ncbi:hypothetical protein Swit_2195 [Rhizorhabdus wittichii RW1]|uniref:Uncharacterized protein n=1 Tax=Rhizorhabdus wittichii (strain DSM 6014 / CCUG 31198 / JCM 15750 / NBRC 105917 / EY 4224 / RW1) TaxID=392499 RepID=A0A9J9LDW9_RHIWR|nr:hypothetical protein Swit_2195 [Rhizorhabdus wittichii RW1]
MRRPDNQRFRLPSDTVPNLSRAFMNFELAEERLVEAMTVLLQSGDREWSWLHPGTLAMWRQYRPEVQDDDAAPLRTCEMTRAEVERAEEAMRWIDAAVPAGLDRRIMGIALVQLASADRARIEWPAVLRRLGRDGAGLTTEAVRKRYNRAVSKICERKNARTSAA